MKIIRKTRALQSIVRNRNYSGGEYAIPDMLWTNLVPLLKPSVNFYISEEVYRLVKPIRIDVNQVVPGFLPGSLALVSGLVPTSNSPLIVLEFSTWNLNEYIPSTYVEPIYSVTVRRRTFVIFKAPLTGVFQPFNSCSKDNAYSKDKSNLLLKCGATVHWIANGSFPLYNEAVMIDQMNPYCRASHQRRKNTNTRKYSPNVVLPVLPEFFYPNHWNTTQEDASNAPTYKMRSGFDIIVCSSLPDTPLWDKDNSSRKLKDVAQFPMHIVSKNSPLIPGMSIMV